MRLRLSWHPNPPELKEPTDRPILGVAFVLGCLLGVHHATLVVIVVIVVIVD
jgi:hypothetical protein